VTGFDWRYENAVDVVASLGALGFGGCVLQIHNWGGRDGEGLCGVVCYLLWVFDTIGMWGGEGLRWCCLRSHILISSMVARVD